MKNESFPSWKIVKAMGDYLGTYHHNSSGPVGSANYIYSKYEHYYHLISKVKCDMIGTLIFMFFGFVFLLNMHYISQH